MGGLVGGWVKKGILKGKGAQKGPRVGHCIIQIRRGGGGQSPEKRSKKGLKGLSRRIVSFRLVQARPLKPLLPKNSASVRHKLAEPKKRNSMLIGCLQKSRTKVRIYAHGGKSGALKGEKWEIEGGGETNDIQSGKIFLIDRDRRRGFMSQGG